MFKKYGFLFGSLAVLVAGLICLLTSGMTYPTLVVLLIGILCTIASMFASLPLPDEQSDIKAKKEIPSTKNNCENNSMTVISPVRKHKILCKYCKNRFPCTEDKCPHCGAPVDISSLTPECLEPAPHEKKVSTQETESTKTVKNKSQK